MSWSPKTISPRSKTTSRASIGTLFPPQHQTTDKAHGRLEIRCIQVSSELSGYTNFPYLRQVFRLERQRTQIKSGKHTSEVVFGLTSLEAERASPERLLGLNRGHWAVENKLHWVRDVTFDEDRSQVRTGHAPRAMASLRNLAMNLLRRAGAESIAGALRHVGSHVEKALRLLGLT